MSAVDLRVHRNVAVWSGGNPRSPVDVWFHPAFGESVATFRQAFASELGKQARIFVHEPPGHGASPARGRGLTIKDCVRLGCELVAHFSGSRDIVLVGHSMAGFIASLMAASLRQPPRLVIGVEANLTRADAYFTGLAARFDDPGAFQRALLARVRRGSGRNECLLRFAANLTLADPKTLWTLGRSIYRQKDPGAAFRRLRIPRIYYWDATRSSRAMRNYVARHELPNRRLDGLGHWPMIRAPDTFYAAILEDLRTTCQAG
jgi:pimeloyl-ACP methyl ester carboxylesterase